MLARRLPTSPLLLAPLLTACAAEDYVQLYYHQPVAPSWTLEDLTTFEHMGPETIDQGVNFCTYSENATRLELLLFDDPESTQPSQQYEMTRYGDFWSTYVEGIGEGQAYGYVAWGPNWTWDEAFLPGSELGFRADVNSDGDRFNPNKLLTDPWAHAYTRPHDWSRGSVASGPWRTESTYSGGAKSVIVTSDYAWSENETLWQQARADGSLAGHDWNELVIYEVHAKGFTANTASGVEHPGTFRGFGEKADYLADLGVTAVELLPVHQKEYSLGGYWGYSNLSYFAPEVSYSADYGATGDPGVVIDEFKGMVDALHQAGVEVILDVVFNHTGEGGLWEQKVYYGPDPDEYYTISWSEVTSIFNLRGLDNRTYYVVSGDGQGFHDNTGVGHDVRANHPATRALILDSLRYYVEELHVDGFRFDLAAVLGQVDGSPDSWDPDGTVLRDIIDDPVLQAHNTRIIAEPWSMGSYAGYDFLQGSYPSATDKEGYAWAEWNDAFRDFWRRFTNAPGIGYDYPLNSTMYWDTIDGGGTLTGSSAFYGDKRPYHGINFLTVHDGYTMYDLFSFNEARNMCGPLNPVCCNDPYSVWCDLQEPWSQNEHDWGDETVKRQLMRNLFTVLLISRGTPMLLGGDEWMRTQYGNNNAYALEADNPANWFRWGEWENASNPRRIRMHDFVRQVIAFRKQHEAAFAPSTWDGGMELDWLNERGTAKSDWSDRHLTMHYHDGDAAGEAPVLVLINGESAQLDFTLPAGSWARVIDTNSWWDASDGYYATAEGQTADPEVSANARVDEPIPLTGSSYGVAAQSVVVLVGR